MPLDLNKLGHLVAVAEEGSLTRAAARLHLSQQALSTSVRVLEREVGVPLLARDSGGVTVLPAGAALLEDARVLLGMSRTALRRARQLGRGGTRTLRVGHTPAVTGDELVALLAPSAAGDADSDADPDRAAALTPEIHQRYPAELTAALLAADLDVGLCRGMAPAYGLARTTLRHQRLHLAVASDHPLAARDTVALSALADETFMVWGTPGRSDYTDLLLDHCRNAGFEPRAERTTRQGTPPVTAVVGTRHLAFVTTPPGPAAGGGARVLALEPPVHAPLHALHLPHTTDPERAAFLARLTA
ncbi:LysR family transcriptional regulator [Streptomyces phytohabitans]|uniref:LysR family transcriptional regulator n=1 Tax=Streptomyces phytohabitans TaxID=1150371 RepID=UPI00345BE9E4